MSQIIEVQPSDLRWPFGVGSNGTGCYVQIGGGNYPRNNQVDPTPCYPHDPWLVREMLTYVEHCYPVGWPVTVYALPFEDMGRTNGYTQFDHDYHNGRSTRCYPSIVLSGKRIPLHPAMTRYLVAHEYGHVVMRWLAQEQGLEESQDHEFEAEYGRMRGLEPAGYYGAGQWHRSVGEVFANDFRLLLCGVEPEYWPHPGIPRPAEAYQVSAIKTWWVEHGGG